jgi:hypothetical protein
MGAKALFSCLQKSKFLSISIKKASSYPFHPCIDAGMNGAAEI